ncbi:MAG: hypothetical protein ABS99_00495 [Acetobacteraceae bacterium SCN 69-10]|nr:hypothetical protein [Rhodospirillales bacterium]ODU62465.1 MAG: hypothetical protein ABS99_00495 [Acetobacteraceae bacterium SCN 69-10]
MTHVAPRKPFYRVTELCARWSMTETDIAAFVLADELTLSIAVSQLPVEAGYYEEVDDGQWCSMPTGRRRFSGTLDLIRDDAWAVLTLGSAGVSSFQAQPGEYLEYALDDDGAPLHIEAQGLVVRRAELERFEACQASAAASTSAESSLAAEPESERRRGAPTKYDVDGFWRHVCRILFHEGAPPKQAQLIRQMRDWFEARLGIGNGPDESWIRKKIAPLWLDIQPDSEWSRLPPSAPTPSAVPARKSATPVGR